MKVILAISSFALVILGASSAAHQVDKIVQQDSRITVSKAEEVAIKEFKKRSRGAATKISVRLLEHNDKEWVFVVENDEQTPAPGSELYVLVNKRTAKAESYFGK